MSYTKIQREVMVEAFKAIRPEIEKGHHKFICVALSSKLPDGWYITRQYVNDQLSGHRTLESWIAAQFERCGTPQWDSLYQYCAKERKKMRETRLAWIDHMIKTLEA